MKSYIESISDTQFDILTECTNKKSYLDSTTDVESFMFPIPEELDVFSNIYTHIKDVLHLDEDVYCSKHTDNQEVFFTTLYKEFKKNIAEKAFRGLERLPKFHFRVDEDGAYILDIIKEKYRLFIDIERKVEDSFYGIILDQQDFVSSKQGKLTLKNYNNVVFDIVEWMANDE